MHGGRRRLVLELLLVAASVVLSVVIAERLGLFEAAVDFSHRHDDLPLDTLAIAILAVAIGAAVFAWRRYRVARVAVRHSVRSRESLLETSARYESLFTHNPHGVYTLDLDGNFVSVNGAAQQLAGRSEEDLRGRNFVELLARGHLEATQELFRLAVSGTSGARNIAIIRSSGEKIDLAIRTSPILVKGTVVGVYGVAEDITGALQMERDLQRTQAAVEATLDGVLIGDEDQRIVYANDASVRMHGYESADQMLGQPIENFLDSAEPTVFASTVMGLMGQSGRWTGQLLGSRRDRSSFVAEASISSLADGCLVAIARDVTARVEADAALRESEERYRAVLADIGSGYYECDLTGRVVFLNDAAAAIVGRDRDEILGTRFDRYAAPDAVATLRQHAQRVLHTGVTDRAFDWHLFTPDGRRRLVSTSVAAVRDENGEIQGFRGLMHDVTDRHETQRALTLSEERHRLLAQVTREVIFDGDPRAGTLTLSGAIRDLFAFAQDTVEVPHDWWRSRIHPDDLPGLITSISSVVRSDADQWFTEFRLRDEAERYLTVIARSLVIRDEERRAIRFIGSLVDITQRRRHEEELRLAHRAAKDATEAKSLFLANMSHEIRTPLTSVIAGTEMVLDSPLAAQQEKLMLRVQRNGERLLKLVDDLLDFSKIEAGQIRVDTVSFDPTTVIQQTAAWAQDACHEKGLDFRLVLASPLPPQLLGDPDRLAQVLINLIGNAVKFTHAGHVHLHVDSAEAKAHSLTLSFAVEDTGTGISSDHQAHIFQSFSQADSSITRRFGGSGLGLAIAKDIVEFMGGTIGVESRPDHGSRFFFDVPFALPAAHADAGTDAGTDADADAPRPA